MKVLHVTPHLGGGVGTVIMDWMDKIKDNNHTIMCLDYMNEKAETKFASLHNLYGRNMSKNLFELQIFIVQADIVLVHYWDHPMLAELFSKPIPDCRLAFWVHKNTTYFWKETDYPDLWINTSPIQAYSNRYIWSTGNMDRFLAIEPRPHEGFNIGYVGTVDKKKIHPDFSHICKRIKERIPEVRFTVVGEVKDIPSYWQDGAIDFVGKVDDVAPYLAEMDVFAYPLRPDHYGTCEIALGEAMAAGVFPMIMDNPAERLIYGIRTPSGEYAGCKSESEYIEGIEFLYRNPGARGILSEVCRVRARELYSIDNMIASWNQVFESMMQNPKTKKGNKI